MRSTILNPRLHFILFALAALVLACGAEEPWVARSDLVEVELLGEPVTVDVIENDVTQNDATISSVTNDTSDSLEISFIPTGEVTVRALAGSAGVEHFLTYEVTNGPRVTNGTLIVRVVEPPPPPQLLVEPLVIDFGLVPVGQSRTETIAVSLSETADAEFSVSVGGLEESPSLAVDTSDCDGLTELTPCQLQVQWDPVERGVLKEIVEAILDGFLPVEITVVGTASETEFEVVPKSLDFGTTFQSTRRPTRELVIRNTGTTPISLRIEAIPNQVFTTFETCGEIAPGGDCDFQISLATSQILSLAGQLILNTEGGNAQTIELRGEVIPVPRVESFELVPGSLVLTRRTPSTLVTVTNTGNVDLPGVVLPANSASVAFENQTCDGVLKVDTKCRFTASLTSDALLRRTLQIPTIAYDVSAGKLTESLAITVDVAAPPDFVLEPSTITLLDNGVFERITVINAGVVALGRIEIADRIETPGRGRLRVDNNTCTRQLAPRAKCAFDLVLESYPNPPPESVDVKVIGDGLPRSVTVRFFVRIN